MPLSNGMRLAFFEILWIIMGKGVNMLVLYDKTHTRLQGLSLGRNAS